MMEINKQPNKYKEYKNKEFYHNLINSENSDLMVEVADYYYRNNFNSDLTDTLTYEERTIRLLEKAIELNNPKAMLKLGDMYRYGTSYIAVNSCKANDLYYEAAELGNAKAMVNIADMYMNEFNEEDLNYKEAVFWLKKAALKFNYPNGIYRLGKMYQQGLGVIQDDFKAYELMEKAAKMGDEEACIELNIVME